MYRPLSLLRFRHWNAVNFPFLLLERDTEAKGRKSCTVVQRLYFRFLANNVVEIRQQRRILLHEDRSFIYPAALWERGGFWN
jgi:hypothetical protein